MAEKQADESGKTNEAPEFDSSDPFEVLRNADRFEEQERESEKQLTEDLEETESQIAGKAEEKHPESVPAKSEAQTSAKTYKFAGKEYSGEDIVKEYADPEKIMDLLTAREQYRNLNKKHQEVVEEYKAAKLKGEVVDVLKEALPRVPQGPPADPKQVVAQARRTLQPIVDGWVHNGIVDQDTVDAIPDVVAVLAYQQAEFMRKAQEIDAIYERQIKPVLAYAEQMKGIGHQQGVVSALDASINRVTNSGGVYAGLADPEVKAQYVQYLAELNPETDVIFSDRADEFIARQFLAFQGDKLMAMFGNANQAANTRTADASRASGAGSAPRPGRVEDTNSDIKRVLFAKG